MADVKIVMQASHLVAKYFVARTGNYQIALSFALREVWAKAKRVDRRNARVTSRGDLDQVKELSAKQFAIEILGDYKIHRKFPKFVFGVPAWLIEKNRLGGYASSIEFDSVASQVLQETDKAFKIEFTIDDLARNYHDKLSVWVPKSVMSK